VGRGGTIALSNALPSDLRVWVEPWCDELYLPPRAELSLQVEGEGEDPDIDALQDYLVVYGAAGTRLRIFIDSVEIETGSTCSTVPAAGNLSTRDFVELAFGHSPEARTAGRPFALLPRRTNLLSRLFRWRR
jgi:hypothetical protein